MLRLILKLVLLSSILFCQVLLAQADEAKTKPLFLQGNVNSFGILTDELQSNLGIICKQDNNGNIRIKHIRSGSEAYYKGIKEDDIILNARTDNRLVYITINRSGHVYEALLASSANLAKLAPQTARVDLNRKQPFKLQAQNYAINAEEIKVLSHYNLELILDRSLSMRRRDCPGNLSRWDWCGYQAVSLAKALAPYVPNGLTLTQFAMEFDVHENINAAGLVEIFRQHDFRFGTRLSLPLANRLDYFFTHHKAQDKPLLIVVITDGCPHPKPEPRLLRRELVRASHKITRPGEVVVVFLQLGADDVRGQRYLLDLGNNLVRYGASHQYVHTKTFEEIEAVGLAQALVDALHSSSRQ